MNNIPFIDLAPEYSWGTNYDVLLDRFMNTGSVFNQVKGSIFNPNNIIGIEADLKHRFIDHWGNGANTTMEPRPKTAVCNHYKAMQPTLYLGG